MKLLLCWNSKNTTFNISKLPLYILLHTWNGKCHEYYVDYKPFLQSQVQDLIFQGYRFLIIHIGSNFKFEVTPSQFIIYSIVLPNRGCSVITTSCNSSYPQRSLKFNILGPVSVVGLIVRKIFFFSLSLKLSCHNFDQIQEENFYFNIINTNKPQPFGQKY